MSNRVEYQCQDGVATIVMDDGKANVMSIPMLEALHDAFERATRDRAIVVLRSGRPKVFSAGFDLGVLAANDVAGSVAMLRSGAELALKLLAFDTPVVSVCAGHAYPMGAFLLLSSDLRFGVEGDYRIGLNEVTVGIAVPSFALELARSRLHPAWLSRTATTGEMFGPRDAAAAGFLDRVVPAGDMESTLTAAVDGLKRIDLSAHRTVKRRLRGATIEAMRAAIDAEVTPAAFQALAKAAANPRPV
jgi:enoyl-CoA hydratase